MSNNGKFLGLDISRCWYNLIDITAIARCKQSTNNQQSCEQIYKTTFLIDWDI